MGTDIWEIRIFTRPDTCPTPHKLVRPDPAQFWALSCAGAMHLRGWFYSTAESWGPGSYLCFPHWYYSLFSPASCQSRLEGEGIMSSLPVEIVWVRKGVLSLTRTGEKTGSTFPTMMWPWLLGEGLWEQIQREGWNPCQQPLRHHWPLMLKSTYCNNPGSYRTEDFGISRHHKKLKQHQSPSM